VGEAHFHGVVGSRDAAWLWPDSRLIGGAWTRGVPVDIDVGEAGLVFSPRTRLLRGERWAPVTLAWDELAGASSQSRGHTGRTGGLTLRETFEVTLQVVGSRAAEFELPAGVSELLPGFPSGADAVGRAGYAPLMVTMPDGDALAAEVTARASGRAA
jgi:hypothetical protein